MGSQSFGQLLYRYFRPARRGSLLLALVWLLGTSAIPVKAQYSQSYLENIGVPAFTTKLPVESGFINAANGNLHLEIPLGTFPQRGAPPEKVVLMYDSAFWLPWQGKWNPYNTPSYTFNYINSGWRLVTTGDTGTTDAGQTYSGYCSVEDDYSTVTYYPWIYVAPDGTQHAFPASVTTVGPNYPGICGAIGNTPSAAGYASDGSGFYISITNYTNATVYAPDGTVNQIAPYGGGSIKTDSNGNQYKITTPNDLPQLFDSLNRAIVTETVSSDGTTVYYAVPNPQGTTTTYAAKMLWIPISTNFGQSGVLEDAQNIRVLTELDLPDGTKYSFSYDQGTTAGHYGLLTGMTLPTGGTVQYGYGVYSDANSNRYIFVNSRTNADGNWTYAPSVLSNCASGYVDCQQTFNITKPVVPPATTADSIVYTMTLNGGAWPTGVQYFDHASGSLATTTQCFSFVTLNASSGCSYGVVTGSPSNYVHLRAATTTLPIPNGNVSATTQYGWDSNNQGLYGELTQITEWNFGNAPTNAADRTTTISYAAPGANILDRPSNVTVKNNAGTTVAQTLYGYDVYTYNGGSLASVTGMGGHNDNYGSTYTTRGNVTLIQNLAGSAYLNSYLNYDTTGQVTNAFDINGQKTNNVYGCQNAYPTTITNPLTQITTLGYDCNTGVMTSIKDANNQTTGFSYDSMLRPLSIGYPDGGQTTISYNYGGSPLIGTGSTITKKVSASQNLTTANNTDALGRVTNSVTSTDPDGQTTITTAYDSHGRLLKVSNPYRSTSDPTYGFETYGYDGLDRVLSVTHADGHVSSIDYGTSVGSAGGAATQLCPAATYHAGFPILTIDEANNKLQSWIDGFGRTIEADEPTSTSGSLTANTCYGYDANNNLTGVLASLGNQTRSYVYDALSRLTKATNPETGPTTPTVYNYDADSNCAAPNSFPGDLVSRVDQRGIRTCMQYDTLHRPTLRTYSDGITPGAHFIYDVGSHWGITLSNPIGRLTEEYTDTTSPWTASIFGYDPVGRVVQNNQCTPASCGTSNSSISYAYDFLGNMTSYTNGAGVTITQGPFSGAGQLTQVTSSLSDANHPGTLFSNVHYNALGETASATLGNGAAETLTYAPRGWPLTATVQSESSGTPGKGTVTINGSEKSQTNSSNSGTKNAGTFADVGSTGINWGDKLNNDPDSPPAYPIYTQFNGPGSIPSGVCELTNFGFSIPSNATITGVVASITKYNGYDNGGTYDYTVQLVVAGNVVGANRALSTAWPNYPGGGFNYGSSSDTWGNSLTPANVSASNFGFGVSVSNKGSTYTSASITAASMTVYYNITTYDSGTVSVTVNSQTVKANYVNGSTSVSIASALAGSITNLGFVTASTGGTNVITITSTTVGTSTNYPLSASSSSSNGFNPPSFTPSPSGSTLTGGSGAPGTLYSFSLGYGLGNINVTSANDSVNGNWVFTYDYLNRLSTSNQNSGQLAFSYGYDQLGNRTSQKVTAGSGGTLSLSYSGNNNRMDGYSYDAAGNLLGDGLHTYAYDAENRLISVDGGATASYSYDAEGRRVQKKTATQAGYLYDLNGNIMTELSSTGGWNRGEIFANGQHLATYNNGTTYFDHTDWLSTERARSNTSDADCETITNVPFGDSQSMSGTCVDANPQHFTGQQWDSETSNLHYFGARHYSSQFGRFMSPDPTGIFLGSLNDPQSLNLYAYVRNNPTSLTDPSGLQDCSPDDPTCGCDFFCGPPCDPVLCGGGGGGEGGGGIGPQPPIFIPAGGISPNPANGSPASDDPFGGETNPFGLPGIGGSGLLMNPCIDDPEICTEAAWEFIIKVTAWGTAIYEATRLAISHIHFSRASRIRTEEQLKRECKPGRLVTSTATGRAYGGGISYEQEYICSDGAYTVHWIEVGGRTVHGPHVRPGSPTGLGDLP